MNNHAQQIEHDKRVYEFALDEALKLLRPVSRFLDAGMVDEAKEKLDRAIRIMSARGE